MTVIDADIQCSNNEMCFRVYKRTYLLIVMRKYIMQQTAENQPAFDQLFWMMSQLFHAAY